MYRALLLLAAAGCQSGLKPTDSASDTDTDATDEDANAAPFLAFLEPDGVADRSTTTYDIRWNANDPDSVATISLFWGDETDALGLIVEDLHEGTDTSYTWDLATMENGVWFVHAVIADEKTEATAKSGGGITVERVVAEPPTLTFLEPDGVDDTIETESYEITWTDDDPDSNATISLFWDSDDHGADGTLIVLGLEEDDETDAYSFDPTLFGNGTYYIYAIVSDGDNAVTAYAPGPITVFHNELPSITVTEPNGVSDAADEEFLVRWTDEDDDHDATIDLYYDDDNGGEDGTLLVSGISEDDPADQWLWDTTSVTPGNYWVYAVITDGFEVMTDYSDGPVTLDHNPCEPGTGTVTVAMSPIEVVFDLMLDGATVDASNTGPDDEGRLVLRSTTTDDEILLPSAWDDTAGAVAYPAVVDLLEGSYDVYYQVVDNGPNWPANEDALLRADVDLTTDSAVAFDLTTVAVTLDVTLNGAAVDSTNTWSTDEGTLEFTDPTTGDGFALQDLWDDTTQMPAVPYVERLLPGVFDVAYIGTEPGAYWPAGAGILQTDVDLGFDQSVSFDVVPVTVYLDATIRGQPLTQQNTSSTDKGWIWLVEPETEHPLYPGDLWNDAGNANTPFTIKVLPAHYEVWYSNLAAGPNWPWNQETLLMADADLTAPGTTTVDVPAVDVVVDLTLDGAAVSDLNTNDDDEGRVVFAAGDDRVYALSAWDDDNDLPAYPHTVPVVPGTYDAVYQNANAGGSWPRNSFAVLEEDLAITTSTSVAWDLTTAAITLSVTLDGAPIDATNTNDEDEGQIVLLRKDDRVSFALWDDATDTALVPTTFRLLKNLYNVHYEVLNDGPSWPDNADAQLEVAKDLRSDQTLAVDLVATDLSLAPTIDGMAASSANTTEADEGSLTLVSSRGEVIELPGAWDDDLGAMAAPWSVRLLPETYEIHYRAVTPGGTWPANASSYLMCVDVP